MNKRQWKKKKKKEDLFVASFVSSYKELKKLDRDYHEYVVSAKRIKFDKDWFDKLVENFCELPTINPISADDLRKALERSKNG